MKNPGSKNDGENQLNENRCNDKAQKTSAHSVRQPRQYKKNASGPLQDKAQKEPSRSRQSAPASPSQPPAHRRGTKKTRTGASKTPAESYKRTAKSGAAARPSMARMIEAVRNAEARRRSEQEVNQDSPAQDREMAQVTAGAGRQASVSEISDISGRPDISGKTDISGRSGISELKTSAPSKTTSQEKEQSKKPAIAAKTVSSGDNVKTAQVLKKAAEIARSKKEVQPRAISIVKGASSPSISADQPEDKREKREPAEQEAAKKEAAKKETVKKEKARKEPSIKNTLHSAKPSKRAQKWGAISKRINRRVAPDDQDVLLAPHQTTNTISAKTVDPGGPLTTRQTRALRVAEAMRHLKEAARQEPDQTKHAQAQKRLAETLEKMNLSNPQSPILLVALTHPSYTFESPNTNKENNQRLEFLGDAVLDFIIGEYLYLEFQDKSEGELTKIRAAVVNEGTLARAARSIQLGDSLFLGRGEQVSGGRERPSILADALEALIGAFYLEEGYEAARRFVLDLLVPIIDEVNQDHYGDFKTLLQEVAQHDERTVNYRILEELGPDHDKSFTAGVFIQGVLKGKGTGKTKKEAEQLAARLALENWEVKE